MRTIRPLVRSGARIVEIGCAEGGLGAEVKSVAPVHYTGVELSLDSESARTRLDSVVLGTAADVHDGPYDLLLAFHVLEHIEHVEREVTVWRHLLGPEGHAIIEVPNQFGHPLLNWDSNREHLHFFTMSSLTSLCQRCGLDPLVVGRDHFESSVYLDSLRLLVRPALCAADRRRSLVDRFLARVPGPFAVMAIGGDFANYVQPLIDELPVTALFDTNPRMHGVVVGAHVVGPFDRQRLGDRPVLIASLKFKPELTVWLGSECGLSPERIFGLDDVYDASA